MTPDKLDTLQELLAAATERPWKRGNGAPLSEYGIWRGKWFGLIARTDPDAGEPAQANAALICASVNSMEALIAVAKAAQRVKQYDQAGGNEWWKAHEDLYAALSRFSGGSGG